MIFNIAQTAKEISVDKNSNIIGATSVQEALDKLGKDFTLKGYGNFKTAVFSELDLAINTLGEVRVLVECDGYRFTKVLKKDFDLTGDEEEFATMFMGGISDTYCTIKVSGSKVKGDSLVIGGVDRSASANIFVWIK